MTAVAPGRNAILLRARASGSHHSHGPFRESYTSGGKASTRRRETSDAAVTHTAVSAERLPAAFSPAPGAPALLQRALPASGTEMVTLEGTAKLPHNGSGKTKAQRTEPPLSRARPTPGSTAGTTGRRTREGNHQTFFSDTAATVPAAMKASFCNRARRSSASVPVPAGAPWSGSGNANHAGAAFGNTG